jgi:glutamyl-Q tRNA(Asp) synthetase
LQAAPDYVGRFAPSPTGDLHFGSLVAAIASYLQARSAGGRWLVRIEDIDPPREIPGSAASLLRDLGRFGMSPDESPLFQSTRIHAYRQARQRLIKEGYAFYCACTRKDLPLSGIYPGTCRNGLPGGKEGRSVRLRVDEAVIRYSDAIQGEIREELGQSVGDFVIWRADGLPAYQLAVVVDDAFQSVTEVVRGADLLGSTARQIHLQNCLGLPNPAYAHHAIALSSDGDKLSKRLGSDPVSSLPTNEALTRALGFLGHSPPPGLNVPGLWDWAVEHWDLMQVPKTDRPA